MIIDELVAVLGYDIRGEENLRRFNSGLERTAALANRVATALVAAGTIAAGAMLGLGKSVIETSAEFEGFQTSLETIDGSADKAKASMGWISQFAKTTPYEVAGITEAFIKLRSYGVDPMNGTLRTLGDTASAMNKPLNQAVEAFADAATFQFERLKEFGITSSQKGDQVTFSWTKNGKQMTKVVKKNGDDIRKFVLQNFGERFGGAMERQSKTWNGMMSNLGDSWTDFKRRIGDAGFFDNVKRRLAGVLDYIAKLDKNGTLDRWAKGFSDALSFGVDEGVNLIERLVRHFNFLSEWVKVNPDMFGKIKTGLMALGAVMFPKTFALLVLDDILSYLEGKESVIGDFAKSLSELTGVDAGTLGTIMTSLSAAGAGFLLFGGTFGTAAKGLRALAGALGLMASTEAAAGAATVAKVGSASFFAGFAALLAKASAITAPLFIGGDDANNKYANAPAEERKKTREKSRDFVDRYDRATEAGGRRQQMEDLMRPPVRAKDIQNTPGIMELFHNIQGNNAKLGTAAAIQSVVNDNSDRSITVNPQVSVSVQEINQAAKMTGEKTAAAVSSSLSKVNKNSMPARVVGSPAY